MLSMASTIPIKLLKRGRIGGQCKKAVSPLFSYYSSISTPPSKDSNNTDINKNQRYYSTYTPPPNNKYHGTPVYNDINIDVNDVSVAAIARNSDPEAVFVVTGASRKALVLFYRLPLHVICTNIYHNLSSFILTNWETRIFQINGIRVCETTIIEDKRSYTCLRSKTR